MAKDTKTTYTSVADVKAMWEPERARRIIKLMTDKHEPMSYTEAVKWSRRYLKRESKWFEAA